MIRLGFICCLFSHKATDVIYCSQSRWISTIVIYLVSHNYVYVQLVYLVTIMCIGLFSYNYVYAQIIYLRYNWYI